MLFKKAKLVSVLLKGLSAELPADYYKNYSEVYSNNAIKTCLEVTLKSFYS